MSKTPEQGGVELIVYQISQLEKSITGMSVKFDSFREGIETRVLALEAQNKESQFKTKYLLGLAGLVGGVVGFLTNLIANYFKLVGI
jgi:hypothetical protein